MIFRIRYQVAGGHVHMRMFSARHSAAVWAKLGSLCCSVQEFEDLRHALSGVHFLEEEEEK